MALGDYILCSKCECKLIYDGDRGQRDWWRQRWGTEPRIECPDCKQSEQEPVAWGFGNTAITGSNRWMMLREKVPADDQYGGAMWTPLYTAPQRREWVGLTEEDYAGLPLHLMGIVEWAEAKLKEKNT